MVECHNVAEPRDVPLLPHMHLLISGGGSCLVQLSNLSSRPANPESFNAYPELLNRPGRRPDTSAPPKVADGSPPNARSARRTPAPRDV